jgi:hypothetical protein
MTIGFQDKVDITIDAIEQYSQDNYEASWLNNIEHIIYGAIITNDRSVLNYFYPYQISAMKDLLANKYWIMYDNDIQLPVVRTLEEVIADKMPIKSGAD